MWPLPPSVGIYANLYLDPTEDNKAVIVDVDLKYNSYSVAPNGAIGSGCMRWTCGSTI